MAGNVSFDSNSASTEDLACAGNYPDGQRGNYPNACMDRSGSFWESTESRMFSSGASTLCGSASWSGDMPPLTQCLTLDPFSFGDEKCTWLSEVRRVLGISLGSTSEENSFGTAHPKLLPPAATEELKHFKASVWISRSKLGVEQQRSDSFTSERSGGLNILKLGMQGHRNPSDLGSQRLEDRPKSLVLQKRLRSSVAEQRVCIRIF